MSGVYRKSEVPAWLRKAIIKFSSDSDPHSPVGLRRWLIEEMIKKHGKMFLYCRPTHGWEMGYGSAINIMIGKFRKYMYYCLPWGISVQVSFSQVSLDDYCCYRCLWHQFVRSCDRIFHAYWVKWVLMNLMGTNHHLIAAIGYSCAVHDRSV